MRKFILSLIFINLSVFTCFSADNTTAEAEKLYLEGFKKVDNKNTAGAVVDWEKACNDLKYKDACSSLAWVYYMGMGLKQDYNKAVKHFKSACELDDAKSCYIISQMYEKGMGVIKDLKISEDYFKKACKLNPHESYCMEKKTGK